MILNNYNKNLPVEHASSVVAARHTINDGARQRAVGAIVVLFACTETFAITFAVTVCVYGERKTR